jgi:glycosyltransferase involved in cell wall biosynthesis
MLHDSTVGTLLLVRNGVDHDARVLRAARVAERTITGRAIVVGVATTASPAGKATIEGIAVVRLPVRPPRLGSLVRRALRLRAHGSSTGRIGGEVPTRSTPSQAQPESTRLTPAQRLRRTLSGAYFTLEATRLGLRLKPRVVHANDWNTMWTGIFVKLLFGSRLVYDSHELWADRNGRWEWRPWLLACEALFVRAADEVLTSSPGYADALAIRYRVPRPSVVRNIPESPLAASRSRPAATLVVYIGGLMPGRGLEQMIDALPLVPAAHFRAVGPGSPRYRESLLTRAVAVGVLDRVDLRAAVAPAEVSDALVDATAGLCLIQPICRSYELCLPNKLFEYAAAGVPVLATDLPVLGPLIRGEGFGTLAPTTDPHGIAASLERLLEPDGWDVAAQRARAFADAHSWAGEARTLVGVYSRAQDRTEIAGVPA